MTCNAIRRHAMAPPASPTDPLAIRLTEILAETPARRLEPAPAVLVRHMLGAYLCPVAAGDAEPAKAHGLRAGLTIIEDLRAEPQLTMARPFHAVDVIIPWAVLDRIALQVGAEPPAELDTPSGVGVADPTIEHLVRAMLPTLRAGQNARGHYAEQLGLALASHVAHVYGRLRPGVRRTRGGLAPHILRRAQNILRDNLRSPPALETLADAFCFSARHFARAFRDSTGLTPHRWTMGARVAAAKAMMETGTDRLAEIALACGFADQSHLTRVFKRETGMSPAAWRRAHVRRVEPENPTFASRAFAPRPHIREPHNQLQEIR